MPLLSAPTTPTWQRHQALTPDRFGLIPFRSPLLRESQLLSFPRGTEMFQFPQFPLPALCVHTGVTPHDGCRVSPFGHPRINIRSAIPRGFSQPPTSFIGSRRQGIHRWLFVAWNLQRCSCSLCNSQGAWVSVERETLARRSTQARTGGCGAVLAGATRDPEGGTPSKRNRERRARAPRSTRPKSTSRARQSRTE
jgi:hypothetical protein